LQLLSCSQIVISLSDLLSQLGFDIIQLGNGILQLLNFILQIEVLAFQIDNNELKFVDLSLHGETLVLKFEVQCVDFGIFGLAQQLHLVGQVEYGLSVLSYSGFVGFLVLLSLLVELGVPFGLQTLKIIGIFLSLSFELPTVLVSEVFHLLDVLLPIQQVLVLLLFQLCRRFFLKVFKRCRRFFLLCLQLCRRFGLLVL
jgi:hypothetical protein